MDEKKAQELYILLQLVDAQIKELEKEFKLIEARSLDLRKLKDDLAELGKIKPGTGTFIYVGPDIFTRGQLKEPDKVLVNVGAGVFVNKKINEAQKLLDRQLESSEKAMLQLLQNIQLLSARAQAIEQELQQTIK